MLWFQKSREKWVRFRDRNTSFFHAQTIVRRRRSHIQGMELSDGSWCPDGGRLKEEAHRFYMDLFATRDEVDLAGAQTVNHPVIHEGAAAELICKVSREEVTT